MTQNTQQSATEKLSWSRSPRGHLYTVLGDGRTVEIFEVKSRDAAFSMWAADINGTRLDEANASTAEGTRTKVEAYLNRIATMEQMSTAPPNYYQPPTPAVMPLVVSLPTPTSTPASTSAAPPKIESVNIFRHKAPDYKTLPAVPYITQLKPPAFRNPTDAAGYSVQLWLHYNPGLMEQIRQAAVSGNDIDPLIKHGEICGIWKAITGTEAVYNLGDLDYRTVYEAVKTVVFFNGKYNYATSKAKGGALVAVNALNAFFDNTTPESMDKPKSGKKVDSVTTTTIPKQAEAGNEDPAPDTLTLTNTPLERLKSSLTQAANSLIEFAASI